MIDVYAEEDALRFQASKVCYIGTMKPSRIDFKGGHTHNHLKNMELRLMLTKKEIKALRKIMKRENKNGQN